MPDISPISNAFAVVGLADVVYRLVVDVADLYRRCRGSAKEASILLNQLKDLSGVVVQVRNYVDEHKQDPSCAAHALTVLSHIESTLQDCQKELTELGSLAETALVSQGRGWIEKWTKGFSWAWYYQSMLTSCQRLESFKLSLTAMLVLIGRQNELSLQRSLERAANDTKSDMQVMHTAITTQHNAFSADLSEVNASIQTSSTSLAHIKASVTATTQAVENRFGNIEKALVSISNDQALLKDQQKVVVDLKRGFENLVSQIATVSIFKNSNSSYTLEGQGIDSVVLPLLLLRPDFAKAMRTLQENPEIEISSSEVAWLEAEIKAMLAYGHRVAAAKLSDESSWFDSSSSEAVPDLLVHSREHHRGHTPSAECAMTQVAFLESYSRKRKRSVHRFHTAAGHLVIEKLEYSQHKRDLEANNPFSITLRIRLVPCKSSNLVGMSAEFRKVLNGSSPPRIDRLIQIYNLISSAGDVINCVRNNDTSTLKLLLASRQASPFDRDQSGKTLLHHAIVTYSLEVYQLLIWEGNKSPFLFENHLEGYTAFTYFLDMPVHHVTELDGDELCNIKRRMIIDALECGCDPNVVDHSYTGNSHHALANPFIVLWSKPTWQNRSSSLRFTIPEMSELILLLKSHGCDLEALNYKDLTPMLHACMERNYILVSSLATLGADITAREPRTGDTVLHMLLSNIERIQWLWPQEPLWRESIRLALECGCDPNALNNQGYSPTDYAMCLYYWGVKRSIWKYWFDLLPQLGYEIQFVKGFPIHPKPLDEFAVVVQSDLGDTDKTLISGMPLYEWICKRQELYKGWVHSHAEGYREYCYAIECRWSLTLWLRRPQMEFTEALSQVFEEDPDEVPYEVWLSMNCC